MADTETSSLALLQAERIRVEFDSLVAVRDASLSLHSGELLGLIGPNGAGKTTLLRALCGLQPMAAGRVRILDEQLTPSTTHLMQHIGFTPDTPPVYEGLTVRDYLRFIAKAYNLDASEVDERIDFWLEQVWLADKADQKIKALSRGMRQRIGLARTLLPNPTVILLDEPAAGLDPAGRVQFRQLLCNLRDQSKAIIVSSHILADMNEYCTHIAIMSRGSIVRQGTVAHVVASGDGTRCLYHLQLSRPTPQVAGLLEAIKGIDNLRTNRLHIEFEYSSDPEEAANLLAGLIRHEVPVSAFTPMHPDLERAYLQTGIEQVD